MYNTYYAHVHVLGSEKTLYCVFCSLNAKTYVAIYIRKFNGK